MTDTLSLTPVFSVERPPQANGTLPSFVAGVQIAHNGLQAPYNGASGRRHCAQIVEPASQRSRSKARSQFGGPTNAATGGQPNLSSQTYVTGWGVVHQSLFIPVLPSRNGEMGNTAHVVMEGVTGAGIADFFNGLSWGICNPVRADLPTRAVDLAVRPLAKPTSMLVSAAVSSQTGKFEAIRTDLDDGAQHVLSSRRRQDLGRWRLRDGLFLQRRSNDLCRYGDDCGVLAVVRWATRSLQSIYDPRIHVLWVSCTTISRRKFGWGWRRTLLAPAMRIGPTPRTAGS